MRNEQARKTTVKFREKAKGSAEMTSTACPSSVPQNNRIGPLPERSKLKMLLEPRTSAQEDPRDKLTLPPIWPKGKLRPRKGEGSYEKSAVSSGSARASPRPRRLSTKFNSHRRPDPFFTRRTAGPRRALMSRAPGRMVQAGSLVSLRVTQPPLIRVLRTPSFVDSEELTINIAAHRSFLLRCRTKGKSFYLRQKPANCLSAKKQITKNKQTKKDSF